MICPYSFDEPVGSGIPALLDGRYWCMGHIALGMSARRRRCPEDCPVDMGEWGAWRAMVGPFCRSYAATVDYPDQTMLAIAYIPVRALARRKLNAVGWSP